MANRMTLRLDLAGAKDVSEALRQFGDEVRDREMKKALKDGAFLMETAIRDRAPEETGTMKLSIGSVVRTYAQKIIAVVGPRFGFKMLFGGRTHEPARVAHLVEFGHAGPHPAPAHPFVRPAWEERHEAAENLVRKDLEAGLKRAVRRAARVRAN